MAINKINSKSIEDLQISADDLATGSITSAKLENNIAITGDLTVDTNTLYVDSTNNRVGIGTTSPDRELTVGNVANARIGILSNDNTTGASQLQFGDTDNSQIGRIYYEHSDDSMRLHTNNTETMRISSNGSLSIGTTTVSPKLYVVSNSNQNGMIIDCVGTPANYHFDVRNDNSSIFRIDSSSRVGIGTSSPTTKLQVEGSTTINSTDENPLTVHHSDGSSVGITFQNNASNAHSLLINSSDFVFQPAGVTKHIIGSNGRQFFSSLATAQGHGNFVGEVGQNYKALAFARTVGGSEVGSVVTNASSTSYNTSSDYRLKENVVEMTNATDRLKQLQPKRFNFINDADNTVDGFLAHEVSNIVPEAITGEKDATETKEKVVVNSNGQVIAENIEQADWEAGKIVDEDGNTKYPTDSTWEATKVVPVYQGIDQSKLVPLLVKTIQELEARITALEANNP